MTHPNDAAGADREIDVREIPRPQRHRLIFDAFDAVDVGQAVLLINDHEPKHLRDEFERERPGSYSWDAAPAAEGEFRVRIAKLTRTTLPRSVSNSEAVLSEASDDATGSIWQLAPAARDLDANIIAIPAGAGIAQHDGPELDVLIMILSGSGELETEAGSITLPAGEIVWLPKRSQRRFVAGPDGLRYFSVHHRKPTLGITEIPRRP